PGSGALAQDVRIDVNELVKTIIPLTQQPQQPPPPPAYSPPPKYTPAPKPRPAPTPGVSRASVERAQRMLNAMGFDAGPADGVAGQQTLDALNAFQLANGL